MVRSQPTDPLASGHIRELMAQGRLDDALAALYRERDAQPGDGAIVHAINDVRERVTRAALDRLGPLDRVARVAQPVQMPAGIPERYLVEQVVNGERTLEQILDVSTLGRHRTARALVVLIDSSVVQIDRARRRSEQVTLSGVERPGSDRPRSETAGAVILVADANPTQAALARTLTRVVMGKSTSVLKAESGAEVVEVARRERPDLLLLDFALPKLDAVEALRQLKSAGIYPAAVVFVERMDAEFVRGKLPPGAEMLVRPLDKVGLKQAIDRAYAAR